jgi:hypothetical protein
VAQFRRRQRLVAHDGVLATPASRKDGRPVVVCIAMYPAAQPIHRDTHPHLPEIRRIHVRALIRHKGTREIDMRCVQTG